MRVLMTTDTVGGVWTFTCDLTEELLRRGHAVHLVSFGRLPSSDQAGWQEAMRGGHPHLFGFTNSDLPLEWMQENDRVFPEGEALLQDVILRAAEPDVLLSNQFCFGALTGSLPRVVVAHSDVLSWARACKPEAASSSPWLNRYTAMVQRGLLQADTVVAPTRWMLKALTPSFFLPHGGTVIPNGRQLKPAKAASSRRLQAVTAGRLWDEAKGLDLLVNVDLPVPVLLAGEVSSGANAEPVPKRENLRLLGQLSQEDLQAVFRESAVYLCTSRYEPFGLAPLEAAQCGCAVVARDLPSLREVWDDAALYFSDADELKMQVRHLVDDPAALAEAQRCAQSRAERYTVSRMTDGYLNVMGAVLEKRRAMPHVA